MEEKYLTKELLEEIFDRKLGPLKSIIEEMNKSMSFINEQYEELKGKLNGLSQENKDIKKENQVLKVELLNLSHAYQQQQSTLNDYEQYSRRECLEIRGIPQDPHREENTNEITMKVASLMNVELKPEDISVSHRLPKSPHSDLPPSIIVKFVRRDKRDEFYKARGKLKEKTTKDIAATISSHNKIYINESLTKKNKELFRECLQFRKEFGYKFIWSSNGKIYLRKEHQDKAKLICTYKDLQNLKKCT